MIIAGLKFPYDSKRPLGRHGVVARFVIRIHPLALWGVAVVLGVIGGWLCN